METTKTKEKEGTYQPVTLATKALKIWPNDSAVRPASCKSNVCLQKADIYQGLSNLSVLI